MKISWQHSRYDAPGYTLGFQTASIFSTNQINNGDLLFFNGDSSKLVSIRRETSDDVTIRHFSGTPDDFDSQIRGQFDSYIQPWLKDYPLYRGVLYSYELKRVPVYSDFSLLIPPRGQEIFFIKKDGPEFNIYWFDKRTVYKLEDMASLDALCSWNSWGISTPQQGQTEIGKKLMILLNEGSRNKDFPAYLDMDRLGTISNYLTFVCTNPSYEKRIMECLGSKYQESLRDICDIDVTDSSVEGTFISSPLEEEKFIPYLREGKINLTELVDFDVLSIIRYLSDYEQVEVNIDVPDMGIKKMTLVPGVVLLVRDNTKKDRGFYEESLGLDETTLLISDSLSGLKTKG